MSQRGELIQEWSVRLAAEVAPDEAILAPVVADAFAAGGKQRRELFARSDSVLGGFGPGSVSVLLPAVLDALAVTAPLLVGALGSPLATSFIGVLDNGLQLLTLPRRQRPPADTTRSEAAAPGAPEETMYAPLMRTLEAMQTELRAKGVSGETCDAAAYRALKVLFADPAGAIRFVEALGNGE